MTQSVCGHLLEGRDQSGDLFQQKEEIATDCCRRRCGGWGENGKLKKLVSDLSLDRREANLSEPDPKLGIGRGSG